MRIGIDVRLWNETGVGRYIRNLVSNLSSIDRENDYVLFARTSDKDSIKHLIHNSQFMIQTADVSWHGIAEQVRLPKILNEANVDLMHFPYFSIPFFYTGPFVVTVHDLIINQFSTGRASTLPYPVYLAKRFGYKTILSNAIYHSKKIITPSESVKKDILATYKGIAKDKVEVTYEGGFENRHKIKDLKSKIPVEGKYFLRVGNFYPHKNVERLIIAFANYVYETYDHHNVNLVLVGKRDFFHGRINKQIEDLNIGNNVVFMDSVKDEELRSLYEGAVATIVPSLAEGFSLTAVEAMSCGSLLIASDIPVHREICESAAIYTDPGDVKDIQQKMDFALNLVDSSRNDFISSGLKQAQKFSWSRMAKQTLEVYNSLQ